MEDQAILSFSTSSKQVYHHHKGYINDARVTSIAPCPVNHVFPLSLAAGNSRPASAGLLGAPTRPLHEKFRTLMGYLSHHHRAVFGGKDEAECAAKMLKICNAIGGGIELG